MYEDYKGRKIWQLISVWRNRCGHVIFPHHRWKIAIQLRKCTGPTGYHKRLNTKQVGGGSYMVLRVGVFRGGHILTAGIEKKNISFSLDAWKTIKILSQNYSCHDINKNHFTIEAHFNLVVTHLQKTDPNRKSKHFGEEITVCITLGKIFNEKLDIIAGIASNLHQKEYSSLLIFVQW